MPPLRRSFLLLAASLLGPCAFAVNGRIETSARWAENINRASSPVDWRDAWQLETRGALGLFREWQTGLIVSGEVDALAEHTPKFRALDAASVGAGATVRQKFGLGAFAPSVAVDFGLRARDTRLDLDSGLVATAAVRLTKRLLPALRAGVHADWEQHYARSAVYDTKHHRFFVTLAWDITPWLQLSHGNGRLWGSFTANASSLVWPRALAGALGTPISDYYNSIHWTRSDAFGPGWVTYLVDGRVSFYWLELSPALGRNTSVPLRFENRVSVNQVGVKYRQDIWSLSLLHRF
jgi:hypothetical protein